MWASCRTDLPIHSSHSHHRFLFHLFRVLPASENCVELHKEVSCRNTISPKKLGWKHQKYTWINYSIMEEGEWFADPRISILSRQSGKIRLAKELPVTPDIVLQQPSPGANNLNTRDARLLAVSAFCWERTVELSYRKDNRDIKWLVKACESEQEFYLVKWAWKLMQMKADDWCFPLPSLRFLRAAVAQAPEQWCELFALLLSLVRCLPLRVSFHCIHPEYCDISITHVRFHRNTNAFTHTFFFFALESDVFLSLLFIML